MALLAPLGLLGLLLLIPVIAMYLLKRRREEALVSSTFLWERTLQDLEANAPWQKLRRNLLLLLQLLVLTLLAIALARPFLRGPIGGQSLIVVLDSSLSMAARDVEGRSRLDAAKQELLRLGDSLDGGRITVIRGGDGADQLISNSDDLLALREAIAPVRPTARDSDLGPALTLADTVAQNQPESKIVVISDGAVQLPAELVPSRPVHFVPVGSSSQNQGITLMTLQRTGEAVTLLVGATNYDAQVASRRLTIHVDGTLFTVVDLVLEPGQPAVRELLLEAIGDGSVVEARLEGQDALAEDDRAWAVPGKAGASRARLLTPDPKSLYLRYLTVPLELLLGSPVEVAQAGVDEAASGGERADLLVVNHWLPGDGLPGTTENLLLLNPPPGNPVIEAGGVFTNPIPLLTGALPALGEGLRFEEDLFFVEARETLLPASGRVVIEDAFNGQPLLWAGELEGRRVAVFTPVLFGTPETPGLQEVPSEALLTNLVFQPAYPLLMARLVDYLAAGPAGNLAGLSVTPGESVPLPLLGPRGVEVLTPSGQTQTFDSPADGQALFFTPPAPGVYTVRWPDSSQPPVRIAANYFLPNESAIAPQASLALKGSDAPAAGGDAAAGQEGRRPWWRPFAFAALALLAIEWLVYQKDAVARLRQRLARA